SYSYAINNASAAVQALAVGETLTEVYTYTLSDGEGGTDTATLTITIDGTNDLPVATANLNAISEDAVSPVTGNLLSDNDGFGVDSDPDTTDVLSVSAVDATGANQYGTLTWNADGSYSYAINNASAAVQALAVGETLTEVYTYTLSDGEGGTDTATLTITINGLTDDKGIVVGQNISDTSLTQGTAATADDHVVDNTPSAPDGPIDGTPSADVLIGDVGGATTTVVPGANYNIVLIVDTSRSMDRDAATGSSTITTISRINLLKDSLANLVNQLDDHSSTGGKVNISLVNFATDIKTVDLNGGSAGTPSSVINLTTLNSAGVLSAISGLSATGGTNYEAAFVKANSEIASLQASYSAVNGYQTITYFLTDGDPTYRLDSSGNPEDDGDGSATSAAELQEAIGAFVPVSSKSIVYAIGIGTSTNEEYLQFFDNTSSPVSKTVVVGRTTFFGIVTNPGTPVTGPAATPDIVTTGDQLDSILQGGSTTTTVDPVGNDVINGGGGADAILGDSIFSTSIDKGWAAYVAANPSLTTDQAKADDIYANLTSSNPAYAREGTVGGNDVIDAGAGNDIVFGQGGNDVISGGAGDDRIVGGTGVDTMTGGDGADQFIFLKGQGSATQIDTITDFAQGTDTIVINGTNITGVTVMFVPLITGNTTYTFTVTYSGGAPTDVFKVALSNGATLLNNGTVITTTSATIDGTIVGATLYLDINQNNQEDFGERLGVTDAQGHVEWVVDLGKLDVNGDGEFTLGEARAVQSGGLDIDTGLTYEINLYGQVGASVVTPLTSLLQTLLESGVGYASANATLSSRLGLPAGSDLTTLNPILGSNAILGQNAAVMTAAVQFSELAANQLGTDEAHASWSVFSSISLVLSELPDGQVADFSSASLLSAIADQLQLDHLASSDVIAFMAASQLALQHSLDTLPPGADALAAISAVQHLLQGSYAQVLGSVANGDLAVHSLDDLTHTLTAYGQGDLKLDQLDSFDQQLTLAGTDGQITESEFTQAASSLPDLAEDGAFSVAPVDALVADTSVPAADTFIQDVAIPDEQLVEAEVASVADLVAQYVGEHAVTDEAMAEYQQELALTELPAAVDMVTDPAAIEPTADALAALDQVDALLPDDASDGIVTATDVVDDFSYTV
ncbi:VCBS domain-containing protein, partial [Cyanobium sp. Maggiore-St4-Cus]|uniref:VCBS domain-containing protein n=1 Tax=Cyanobium sp. Maggiore-St4-Cus TaxID=2823717 RepID=UPI0020CC6DBE